MPGNLTLGQNYDIEESSNGNLLIKDSTGSVVLKHTDGGNFSLGAGFELGTLLDGSSGNTVYDPASETLGDGNQSADLDSVSTGRASITDTTAIYGYVSTEQSLSAGTGEPVNYDTEVHDNRGEFDPATGAFTPDESGLYRIEAQVTLNNISDNDEIQFGFGQSFDNGELISNRSGGTLGGFAHYTVNISADGFPLDSGSSYQFFINNNTSDCSVVAVQRLSWFTITRAGVSEP